tara:strand:+ start:2376 stop:3119 length:744 start_codon:yes stop_codon:yes gene_type:complete
MNRHLSMRSGNPALNKNTFINISNDSKECMTIDGTVNKTFISLFILFMSAFYSWNSFNPSYIMVGLIGGFIVALITIFKKNLSMYTVPIYAVFEGLALGAISVIFEQQYPGIVSQAVFLTFGIMGALLFAYKTKIIKATENFKLGVFAATGGIAIVYLINFIMSFWGSGISVMNVNNSSMFSIGFSLFVVIIASLNLVLDFDFIEEASERNVPKYMEWYATFGLLVTLIWLYLEILRLLAKLQSRRN